MTNHPHRSKQQNDRDTRIVQARRREYEAKQQQGKHTPGPWSICAGDPSWVATGAVKPINCGNQANARLIAAAPETAAERDRLKALNAELLAVLKDLMWRFNDAEPPCNDADVAQARAAIAKAEGR